MTRRLAIFLGLILIAGIALIPSTVGAETAKKFGVTAAGSPSTVNCSSPATTFRIEVVAYVNYRGLGSPTTVTAKYIGGSNVTLGLRGSSHDVARYTGIVNVPRNQLCDAPKNLRFRALATKGTIRGEGIFYVNSVAGPSENQAQAFTVKRK